MRSESGHDVDMNQVDRKQTSTRHGAAAHALAVGVALAVMALASCGQNANSIPVLDADAERGRQAALQNGCAVCHGQYGQGGAGGGFYGLWGSEVELADGRTVTADADYIRRAIVDPAAEIVAGANITMPAVELTDAEVAAMLTWIEALADQ